MVTLEKEQRIRKLLKKGYNWKQITKEERCSPNTIKKVEEKSSRNTNLGSIRSKALKMYENDRTPLEVAIKLDISAEEAENYKIQYWRLKHMHEFDQMYKDHKDSLPFIISRFHEMKVRKVSVRQLSEGFKLVEQLPQQRIEQQNLVNSHQALLNEYKQGQEEYRQLKEELTRRRGRLRNLVISLRHRNHEKNKLELKIENLLSQLEKIKNAPEYEKIFDRIENEVIKVTGDKNTLIYAASLAIIRAARKYQNLRVPLSDLPTLDLVLTSVLYKSHDKIDPELIKKAKIIYDEIYEILKEKIIADL